MAEYQTAFRPAPRNPSVIVAFWILGLVALFEVIVTCIALTPKIVAMMHSNGQLTTVTVPVANPMHFPITQPPAQQPPLPTTPLAESVKNSSAGDLASRGVGSAEISNQPTAAEAAPQGGNTLSIVSASLEGAGDLSPKKLTIAMKSLPQETIDVPQVKVQVYFYDDDGGEIAPSKAQSVSRWLSSGTAWKNGEPELLEVRYLPDSSDADVKFAGYVVALYYKGDLQDYRAEPSRLTKLFPLKYYIGTDE